MGIGNLTKSTAEQRTSQTEGTGLGSRAKPPWTSERVASLGTSLLLLLSLTGLAAGQYVLVARKDGTLAAVLYGIGLAGFLGVLVAQRFVSTRRQSDEVATGRLFGQSSIGALSAILLLVSLVTVDASGSTWITLGSWAASLVLVLVAVAPRGPSLQWLSAHWWSSLLIQMRTREMAAVGFIILVGTALRLYDLAGIPSGIHGDETGHGLIAASIVEGKGPNPFGTAFLGDRALYFYLEAPFIAFFGRTVIALRLFSALAGVATLPAFYMLIRRLFGVRPAVIALALLAGSGVFVNYSRLGLNVDQVPLLTCLSLYCVWRGQESRRAFWWLASGILAGLAAYFAFGGALVAGTIGLYFVYLLVSRPTQWRTWLIGGSLSALGGAMSLVPIPVYMMGRNDQFTDHVGGRLIFNNWEQVSAVHHTSSVSGVLWGQLKANLLYFFNGADAGPFYAFSGAPMLASVLGPLVALALLLMLLRIRDARYAMLAFWFWTVVLVGGVLTINSPHSHRLLPAALAALAGVALVLEWLVDIGPRLVPRAMAPAFLMAAVAVPAVAGFSDNVNYFGPAVASKPWEWGTMQGQYVASLGPGYRVYSLAAPQLYFDFSVTRFLAPDVQGDSLLNPALSLPLAVPADRDLAFLVFPNMADYLPLLRTWYPGAELGEVRGRGNQVVFTTVRVPKAEIARWQGLSARYADVERQEFDASALGGGAGKYPTDATWSGSIYANRTGSYLFEIDGPPSDLLIDGVSVDLGRELPLGVGWHSLEIRSRLADARSRLRLRWRTPNQPLAVILPQWLDSRQLAGDLRGRWTAQGGAAGDRRDGAIGFRNIGALSAGSGAVTVQWEGTIDAPIDGQYGFGLKSTGEAQIALDGRTVVTTAGDNNADRRTTGAVRLVGGVHSFAIRYSGRQEGGQLETFWSVPGSDLVLIPPEAFGPPQR